MNRDCFKILGGNMKETTYVMVKPQFANIQQVIDEVKHRLIEAGLEIEKESFINYDVNHARQHYAAHVGKPFYPDLERYITSDKAYGMIVVGENAISTVRLLAGATKEPEEGSIRHDIPVMLNLPIRVRENVVHSSDCKEAAKTEIDIFEDILSINATNVVD